ncbi:MAG: adenylate kinase [Desulfurococcales archaeon]|nr:adenylate kinase [Desulfurococcales archaeon]
MSSVKLAVIVGLPGVGKSTVLNLAKRILTSKGYHIEIVNFGDYMLSYVASQGLAKNRDEIRRLPLHVQRKAQEEAAKNIRRDLEAKASSEDKVVGFVDTHAVIKTVTGYWPGLPLHVIKNLMPNTIVVVEAEPEEIVARQLRDKTRYRSDYADVKLVKELLSMNRMYAIASAVLVGASVNFIMNREGKADEAARRLAEVIEGL